MIQNLTEHQVEWFKVSLTAFGGKNQSLRILNDFVGFTVLKFGAKVCKMAAP